MISHASQPTPSLRDCASAPPLPLWKRTLDLAICLAVLPVFAVVCAVIAIWITLCSPGPIFFRQHRVGYMGRRFMLYKFRTMRAGAETASHRDHFASLVTNKRPMQKLDAARDARLIPGGWLLRASGIDELPQFLNVLRGDMSFVGPRPCIPYEYDQYTPAQRARFSSAPGLTGLWQVSGKNRTTFDEMVRLDIEYSRTKSLLLDLKIVARTVPALWRQIQDTQLLRRTHVSSPALSRAAGTMPTRHA